MQEFFYNDGTKTANGPHKISSLMDLLREKVISELTLVCRSGEQAWHEFRSIPELAAMSKGIQTVSAKKIPANWAKWCKSGSYDELSKAEAVRKCLDSGQVRGYYSDIVLRPEREPDDSMYPSFEHVDDPKNHSDAVVEARIINTMKSHLSEDEFWRVIEHLFIVGVEKSKIKAPFGKRLPKSWSPKRHYKKITVEVETSSRGKVAAMVSPKVAAKLGGTKSK